MAAVDGSIRIDTKIDTSKAEKGVGSLYSAIGKLGKLIASVFAISTIVNFTKSSVTAYKTQLEAEQQLTTVLQNRYNATQDVIDSIYDLTAAQQAQGVIGDEVQMAGLKTLASYVSNVEDLKALTESMNDTLAFQYGFDATGENASQVAKAMGNSISTGTVTQLRRLGIAIDDATAKEFSLASESERVAILQKVIAERVGGTNEALAKTPYGRIVQLKNAWGDFKEQIGEAATNIASIFVPALTTVLRALTKVADKLIDISNALQSVFLGGVSNSAITDTAAEAAEAEDDLAESIEGVGDAIAGNLAGFDDLNIMQSATSEETDDSTSAGGTTVGEESEIDPELISSAEKLKEVLEPIISLLKELVSDVGGGLKELKNNILVPIFELLSSGLKFITSSLQTIYDGAIKPLANAIAQNILPRIKEFIEYGKELFEELKPLATLLIEKITPAIKNIGTALSLIVGGALSKALTVIRLLGTSLTELITAFTSGGDVGGALAGVGNTVLTVISNIVDSITTYLPKIAEFAGKLIETVATGIADKLPQLVEAALGIIEKLVEALLSEENINRIAECATAIIKSLVSSIASALPKLADAAVNIIKSLCNFLCKSNTIKLILNAAITLIKSLVQALIDSAPTLIDAAIQLIETLVLGLLDCIPQLVEAAVQLIISLAEALCSADLLNTIIDAALTIIITLVNSLLDCLPQIIEAGVNLILALVECLTDPETLQKIIEVGIQLIFSIIDGLIQAIPQLIEAIPQIISAIWDAFTNINWLELGGNILKGIGNGIKNAVTSVVDAAKNACKSIWSGIKNFFGINSPSALMRDTVGNYIAEGIGEGFEDEMTDVGKDMEKSLQDSVDLDALADSIDLSGKITLPKFDTNAAIPYKVTCEICEENGNTLNEIRNAVEAIEDDVSEIKNSEGKSGEVVITVTDANGNVKAKKTVELARRENLKAGKTIIPVGT